MCKRLRGVRTAALILGMACTIRLNVLTAAPQSQTVLSNPHFRNGMTAYNSDDFKKAIPELKAALDELKPLAGFETSVLWRVLVDNLGMAYGISGDLKNAKATFDYGVSKDEKYPMFHYNLACAFAEMNERDNAIAELKQAFTLKANSNPGESIPSPATDDSFERFMKDKVFLAALDEIRNSGRLFPDRLDFSGPAVPWVLTIPAEEFEIQQSKETPARKQTYFFFKNEKTGIAASIFIEPAIECMDSKSCRDLIRTSNLPAVSGPENVSSSEIGDVSVFEYFLPSYEGQPVRQQNLYAEFVQDGFWVDLHISKILYTPQDRKLFEALVRSVRFERKK